MESGSEKRLLQSLKKELKCWESMFERKHGRKPSKIDIEKSPAEIQDAYRQYRHLKTCLQQIEGAPNGTAPPTKITPPEDEVFGQSLNKPVKATKKEMKTAVSSARKPVWNMRRWTKEKGYVTDKCDGVRRRDVGSDVMVENEDGDPSEIEIPNTKSMPTVDNSKLSQLEDELKSLTQELKLSESKTYRNEAASVQDNRSIVSGECQNVLLTQRAGIKASRLKHTSKISTQWLGRCRPNIEQTSQIQEEASDDQTEIPNMKNFQPKEVQLNRSNLPTYPQTEDIELTLCPSPVSPRLKYCAHEVTMNDDAGTWSGDDAGDCYSDSSEEDDPVINEQMWHMRSVSGLKPSLSISGKMIDEEGTSTSVNTDCKPGPSTVLCNNELANHKTVSNMALSVNSVHSATNVNTDNPAPVVSSSALSRLEIHPKSFSTRAPENKTSKPKQWIFHRDDSSTFSESPNIRAQRHSHTPVKQKSLAGTSVSKSSSVRAPLIDKEPTSHSTENSNSIQNQTNSTIVVPKDSTNLNTFDSDSTETDYTEMKHMETADPSPNDHIPLPSTETDGTKTVTKSVTKPSQNKQGVGAAQHSAVSENYVRLNMKVKRFSRKRGLTGSAHKRMAWKKIQKSRTGGGPSGHGFGKGGRSDVCYKCGNSGHWAKNCNANIGSKNLGKFDGEAVGFCDKIAAGNEEIDSATLEQLARDSPFPTVEDAAKMACGVKFVPSKNETLQMPTPSESPNGEGFYVPPPSYDRPAPRPRSVEPLFPTVDGRITATPESVYSVLKKFGYESFRPGQEEAVMRVLSGVSTLLINSTGSGKSLCYQLPAYIYCQTSSCLSLVVSPLVSLMEDQVHHFPTGLRGACLHTSQTKQQRNKVLQDAVEGRLNVLLLSPEALVGGTLWSKTGGGLSLSQLPPVAFACIDEAHCVSEWSHNFRPSYLRVYKVLRERLGVYCVLALTATATHQTAVSVATNLSISPENIIHGATLPDNLKISVSCDLDRDQALIDLLQNSTFNRCDSIIIYCTRQQETERVAQLLRTCLTVIPHFGSGMEFSECDIEENGLKTNRKRRNHSTESSKKGSKQRKVSWSAESYHAGMQASRRRKVQSDFMSGQLRIVVATVAFGMGLNKSDVRAIIHYNLPKSFESFVQEIGRAGRDGLPAYCHVFIDKMGGDLSELRRHAYSNTVERYCIKQFVGKVFPSCHCRESKSHSGPSISPPDDSSSRPKISQPRWCNGHEVAIPIEAMVTELDVKEECVSTLLCYLELEDWLEVMTPVNDSCTLKCYNGARQLRALAGKVPAVAAATARLREKGIDLAGSTSIRFSVVEVADSMGWESIIVHSELSGLSYNDRGTGDPNTRGSSVLVEFSDLSFHLRAPGDLTAGERDSVCEFLYSKVKGQEEREIEKLHLFHAVLCFVAGRTHNECFENEQDTASKLNTLNDMIKQYFSEDGLSSAHLEEMNIPILATQTTPLTPERERQVCDDIQSLVSIHSEHRFTGRAIARIFQGIASPLFEAVVWGGQKRFWRKHMDLDFNLLCQLATRELLHFR